MGCGGYDVFVSYTADDLAWAEWTTQMLESAGLTVRMQAWDVPAGANFVEWIGQQLQGARHIVALYSAEYFKSYWCTQEWTSALVGHSLIPIRVDDVEPPPPLSAQNYVDLFNVDEDAAERKLLEAVNILPILRRASSGFPGAKRPKTDSPAIPARSIVAASIGQPIDQWLNDLAALARAKDLIDESVRIEFQRRILERRFAYHNTDQTTQGGPR
jgi:hypothetical protein